MLGQSVCGFVVLRKPEFNFDEKNRRGFRTSAPHFNNIYYGGVDRMPWFEVEEEYYNNILPQNIRQLYKELESRNSTRPDFLLNSDIKEALILLEYSNRKTPQNELVAVYSKKLADVKGKFPPQVELKWLGIDINCSGFGSQILEGIFSAPNAFPDFHCLLNQNGLFDKEGPDIDRYIQAYNERAKDSNLEPMADVSINLDIIHLARVTP